MNVQHQTLKNNILFSLLLSVSVLTTVFADVVKVTPLGSHSGEFCCRDRALVVVKPKEKLNINRFRAHTISFAHLQVETYVDTDLGLNLLVV